MSSSNIRASLCLFFLLAASSDSQTVTGAAKSNTSPKIVKGVRLMQVSETALTFTVASGVGTAKQALQVTSSDGTPISFSVKSSTAGSTFGDWLGFAVFLGPVPNSGTTPSQVVVDVDASLSVSTLQATLTLTAITPGVSNSPLVVPVTVIVLPPNTVLPSPSSVSFTQTTTGAPPPPQNVTMLGLTPITAATFGNPLPFTVGSVMYNQGQGWLTVTQSGPTTPATLTLTANGTGMAAGTYTAQIFPVSPGYTTQPLSVTLTIVLPGGFTGAGSMAHFAAEGSWVTTITLVNNGTASAPAHLDFFDDNGNPAALPLIFPQTSSALQAPATSVDSTLNPGAGLVIQTAGPDSQPTQTGWIRLLNSGNISGFAVFKQIQSGSQFEATVPIETRNPGSFVLFFDNTNGYVTSVALANIATSPTHVEVVIRDDIGEVIQSDNLSLAALGHTAFVISERFGDAAQGRGTMEFDTPVGGQISVLGLSFNPTSAFTTIPALAK